MGEPKIFITWDQLRFISQQLENLKYPPKKTDRALANYRDGIDDCIALLDKIARGRV